jgi:hypothetical protein
MARFDMDAWLQSYGFRAAGADWLGLKGAIGEPIFQKRQIVVTNDFIEKFAGCSILSRAFSSPGRNSSVVF